MKALLFDPCSGASGDMIISALIDLGADSKTVTDAMEAAADVSVSISRVKRVGLSAVRTEVVQNTCMHRSYLEVREHIQSLDLPPGVKADAAAIYERLAAAESRVHGTPLSSLHFHEVGQDDAIADIVGACTAIHLLMPEQVYCKPVSVGTGMVKTSHGIYPLPAPTTLEVLRNSHITLQQTNIDAELLTPTGAAILAHYAAPGSIPPLRIQGMGYGAGAKEHEHANVLRIISADIEERFLSEAVEVVETSVDDVTGEVLGHLINRLLAEGARDACIIPTTTKKNRSGHIIKAVTVPKNSAHIAGVMMEETGSLGVRILPARHRLTVKRSLQEVQVSLRGECFTARVKIATDASGRILNVAPEFDDCERIAENTGIPVKHVLQRVEAAGWNLQH